MIPFSHRIPARFRSAANALAIVRVIASRRLWHVWRGIGVAAVGTRIGAVAAHTKLAHVFYFRLVHYGLPRFIFRGVFRIWNS